MAFFQLLPTTAPPPEISTTSANFTVPCATAPVDNAAANAAATIIFFIHSSLWPCGLLDSCQARSPASLGARAELGDDLPPDRDLMKAISLVGGRKFASHHWPAVPEPVISWILINLLWLSNHHALRRPLVRPRTDASCSA